MKKYKFLALLLAFCIGLYPLSSYAQTVTVNNLLAKLTKPRMTSLQKLDIIEQYKGQFLKGKGIVKDISKPYGSKNEAMVQLKKRFKGKQYEIILMASEWDLEKIKTKETIAFKGTFVGMRLGTLRFKDVKIIKSSWWPL